MIMSIYMELSRKNASTKTEIFTIYMQGKKSYAWSHPMVSFRVFIEGTPDKSQESACTQTSRKFAAREEELPHNWLLEIFTK